MSEISLRPGTTADIPAIFAFDHIAAQSDQGRQEFIRQAVEQRACLVAVLGGKIVGYGVLEYSFFACGFIEMVYIHPEHRRQRVAQALLAHMEAVCKTPRLFTSTNLSNLPMQSLLGKCGYLLSGVIHNLDEGDPELVYFKALPAQDA